MRVLLVAHAFPPEAVGGTERYAGFVADGLRGRGHEVQVFAGSLEWREQFAVESQDQDGLSVTRVHRHDLYFDHWDKVANPHVSREFEALLDEFQPDVVHLHHWIRLGFDLVRRAAARGVPAVVHLHDLFLCCPRVFRFDVEGRDCDQTMGPDTCRRCVPRWKFQGDAEIDASVRHYGEQSRGELETMVRAIAPSQAHADFLRAQFPDLDRPLEVLAHPRWPRLDTLQGTDAASPAGRLRLLYFSHLNPIKGAHVVLEAMRSLGEDSGVELDLHGEFATPEYERRLRDLADGLAVRFHGAYEWGEPAATAADVVVLPSQARESYSFLLDEALSMGHPILASDVGALAERGGNRVLRIAPTVVDEWAGAIRRLRDDPGLRQTMRAAAASPGIPPDVHLDQLESWLAEAVAEGPPQRPVVAPVTELLHDWERRELAFRELLRSEGWEEVLGRQHAELEKLRKAVQDADKPPED